MKDLQVFNFKGNDVREITDQKGDPWFVAKDVCAVLMLADGRTSIKKLDEDERHSVPVMDSMGREQETAIINESGLYSLILKSRKPEAKEFKRWITHEVLPSIRKTGSYGAEAKPIQLTASMIREMRLAETQRAKETMKVVCRIAGVPEKVEKPSPQMDLFKEPSMSKQEVAEGFHRIGKFLDQLG